MQLPAKYSRRLLPYSTFIQPYNTSKYYWYIWLDSHPNYAFANTINLFTVCQARSDSSWLLPHSISIILPFYHSTYILGTQKLALLYIGIIRLALFDIPLSIFNISFQSPSILNPDILKWHSVFWAGCRPFAIRYAKTR